MTYEDEKGNRQIDTQVIGNIRRVIVPILAEALKYIPLPSISNSNAKREYTVDNVVLCGYDVIPDNVFVHLESDAWLSIRELEAEKSYTRLVVSLQHIRTEFKDVHFTYKRKTFPKVEEAGRVTVRIGGKGATLTITFRVEQKPSDTVPKFVAGVADFEIGKMNLEFDRTTLKHDVMVPIVTKLFKSIIVRAIERGVEKNITKAVNDVGTRLTEALVGAEPKFAKQLESLRTGVKKGKFAQSFHRRQEKLE